MDAERIEMHIDRAHQVAVAHEAADPARPISPFGLVTMPTCRTPARGASFGAGEAHDVGLLGFVGEVIDIFAIFPRGHALVVMPASISVAHAVGIADEEATDVLLNTEVNDGPRGFMTHITHAPLRSAADFVLRPLQFLPAARVFLAAALLVGELSQLSVTLAFERADAAPGHDQGRARVGGHGGQVDFPQVDRGLPVHPEASRLLELPGRHAVQNHDSTRGYMRQRFQEGRAATRGTFALCPSARRLAPFPCSPPGRASERDRSVSPARDTSCASQDVLCAVRRVVSMLARKA